MKRILDENGHIVPEDYEKEETRIIRACYFLYRRGEDFHEWLARGTAAIDRMDEIIKSEKKAKEKPKKKPFDPKRFREWAKGDSRYVQYLDRLSSLGSEEHEKMNATEGEKLFAELKRDFESFAA